MLLRHVWVCRIDRGASKCHCIADTTADVCRLRLRELVAEYFVVPLAAARYDKGGLIGGIIVPRVRFRASFAVLGNNNSLGSSGIGFEPNVFGGQTSSCFNFL